MTRAKKTEGERIAMLLDPEGTIAAAIWRKRIAADIDRAIRRAQAKAWDECYVRLCESDLVMCADIKVRRDSNPYRGKKR